MIWKSIFYFLPLFLHCQKPLHGTEPAYEVLERVAGKEIAQRFHFILNTSDTGNDYFFIEVKDDRIFVTANSQVALGRGAYHYLRNECGSLVSWSGDNIVMPAQLPPYSNRVRSPFQYHYYMNSVTHGYTTPYWGWERWERELDWMVMHGLDMPLIAGAHEAILYRTFEKLGLTEDEILDYFSGPAHFPWNRMGNIGGWDGPPPLPYFSKQLKLTHLILDRMRELGMHPIIQAFAGFVPNGITRIFPEEEIRELGWGGFKEKVHILAPHSPLFGKIGTLFIKEWENEFGKGAFYLADSFNEMDVPLSNDPEQAAEELAGFGEAVYKPIANANPDAVWVMQGWTFPYHRKNGELFWTPDRLSAMMSRIPDDKLLILDMANEYNALFWKIDYSWQMYNGFFNKPWIYSFIPNMGGKVPLNGVLDFYATAPQKALQYENKKNLVGFGFAPEGIENNEVIYELLSDWGWQSEAINLNNWLAMYCRARYGSYPEALKRAWTKLRESSFGTFTDHPRFRYQFRPFEKHRATVHQSTQFAEAVQAFLAAANQLKQNRFYKYDAIELAAQYFSLGIDTKLEKFQQDTSNCEPFNQAIHLMGVIDRLLTSHPNHRLEHWVKLARDFGNTKEESDYYEANAKRLITTWGGGVNDYSARMWSGLTGEYYRKRWQMYYRKNKPLGKDEILDWEEKWITTPWESNSLPFDDPISIIKLELAKLN